jgi:hypothetical protein
MQEISVHFVRWMGIAKQWMVKRSVSATKALLGMVTIA